MIITWTCWSWLGNTEFTRKYDPNLKIERLVSLEGENKTVQLLAEGFDRLGLTGIGQKSKPPRRDSRAWVIVQKQRSVGGVCLGPVEIERPGNPNRIETWRWPCGWKAASCCPSSLNETGISSDRAKITLWDSGSSTQSVFSSQSGCERIRWLSTSACDDEEPAAPVWRNRPRPSTFISTLPKSRSTVVNSEFSPALLTAWRADQLPHSTWSARLRWRFAHRTCHTKTWRSVCQQFHKNSSRQTAKGLETRLFVLREKEKEMEAELLRLSVPVQSVYLNPPNSTLNNNVQATTSHQALDPGRRRIFIGKHVGGNSGVGTYYAPSA